MALYGNNIIEDYNTFKEYINENFLNSVLNEEANNILNDIRAYKESGEGQFELAKKIVDITDEEFKNFDSLTKEHLIEAYLDAVRYRNIYLKESIEFPENISTLLEYSGNPMKNAEFKKTLEDVDRALSQYMLVLGIYDSTLNKFIELYKNCKDVDSARNAYMEAVKISKAGDKSIDSIIKGAGLETHPFSRISKQLKKFNNKYSTVAMEEKKVFDKKLSAYTDKVNDIIEPWAEKGAKIEELNLALDNFNSCMPELMDKAIDYAGSWYHYMFELYRFIAGECMFLRTKLGLEKENGFIYKMVQKIFKK